jgi:molybdopterin synthase sulfur carrier subunit
MARVRLFASAREAAGTAADVIDAATVAELLAAARSRYGEGFAAVVARCRVWVNGEPASPETPITAGDEVAILPPVSGGGR